MKNLLKILLLQLLFTSNLFAQKETGLASYYNDKYHGAKTYSGERYDKNALTCAHKSLPMGTHLKVTRIDNQKSVVVRVNDRMSSPSRVIDISRAGAEALDLVRAGTSKVTVEVVEAEIKTADLAVETENQVPEKPQTGAPEVLVEKKGPPVKPTQPVAEQKKPTTNEAPKSTPAQVATEEATVKPVVFNAADYEPFDLFEIALKKPEKKGFGVQIAVLSSQAALFTMIGDLEDEWFSSVLVNVQKGPKDEVHYKLILGPFDTADTANIYKDNLKKKKKISGFVVNLSENGDEK